MKLEKDGETFTFESTGLSRWANCGIIGLGLTDGELDVTDGFDGTFESNYPDSDRPLLYEERVELANYMLDLWTKFKNA